MARSARGRGTKTPSALGTLLSRTFLGRLLLYLLAASLVGGFDLLVASLSKDGYATFYRLVGAEFLLFAIALWAVYVVRRLRA